MSHPMTTTAILTGQRMTIAPGEALRLPDAMIRHAELCIRAGQAWLTLDDTDVILTPGECWIVPPAKSPLVVTALGGAALQLEVLS